MNRTMRKRQKWSWLRKKELDKFLIHTKQLQLTGITKYCDVKNVLITELNAVAPLVMYQENALLDNLINEIPLTVDFTDDYFIDLFKQGYI